MIKWISKKDWDLLQRSKEIETQEKLMEELRVGSTTAHNAINKALDIK